VFAPRSQVESTELINTYRSWFHRQST